MAGVLILTGVAAITVAVAGVAGGYWALLFVGVVASLAGLDATRDAPAAGSQGADQATRADAVEPNG